GKGVLHSEGPTKNMLDKGGVQEFIQLWINVPKANKWGEPFYQSETREEQPRVLEQPGADFRLASGKYEGKASKLMSFTPIVMISGALKKDKKVTFAATPGYWT